MGHAQTTCRPVIVACGFDEGATAREHVGLLAHCRFYNCHHLHEPGCAVLEAVDDGRIAPERQALYAQLMHEISQVVR